MIRARLETALQHHERGLEVLHHLRAARVERSMKAERLETLDRLTASIDAHDFY